MDNYVSPERNSNEKDTSFEVVQRNRSDELEKPLSRIKIYSKGSCPRHKNEPLARIINDDIIQYLREINQGGKVVTFEEKVASNNDLRRGNLKKLQSSRATKGNVAIDSKIDEVAACIRKLDDVSLKPSFGKTVTELLNDGHVNRDFQSYSTSRKVNLVAAVPENLRAFSKLNGDTPIFNNDASFKRYKSDFSPSSALLRKQREWRKSSLDRIDNIRKTLLSIPTEKKSYFRAKHEPPTRKKIVQIRTSTKRNSFKKFSLGKYEDNSTELFNKSAKVTDSSDELLKRRVNDYDESVRRKVRERLETDFLRSKVKVKSADSFKKTSKNWKNDDWMDEETRIFTEALANDDCKKIIDLRKRKSAKATDLTHELIKRLANDYDESVRRKLREGLETDFLRSKEKVKSADGSKKTSKNWRNVDWTNEETHTFTEALAKLPTMSYFPRKNRDRCLSCLNKSVIHLDAIRISALSSRKKRRSIEREIPRNSASNLETPSNFKLEKDNFFACTSVKRDDEPAIVKKSPEKISTLGIETRHPKSVAGPGTILNAIPPISSELAEIEKPLERDTKSSESTWSARPTKLPAKSISILSERLSASSSSEGENSHEDDTSIAETKEITSDSRCVAACHLPTVLKPSLEPLRLLRLKKSAALRTELHSNESASLAKMAAENDYDEKEEEEEEEEETEEGDESIHVTTKQRRSKSKADAILTLTTSKDGDKSSEDKKSEGREKTPKATLSRVKSASENLIGRSTESDANSKSFALERGFSCSDLRRSGATEGDDDSTRGPSDLASIESRDAPVETRELDEVEFFASLSKSSLFSSDEIARIYERFLKSTDLSSIDMLDVLCGEFSSRLTKFGGDANDGETKRKGRIVRNLVKLLAKSRRYLYPRRFPSDLTFSSKQPSAGNSRFLRSILMMDTYNLIAPILGMPEYHPKMLPLTSIKSRHMRQRSGWSDSSNSIEDDMIVHHPSKYDVPMGVREGKTHSDALNPYALFTKKPRRKVITWRPLTEIDLKGYDPEATLRARAKNLTDKICRDFCRWLENLGDKKGTINEEVLKDMFEVNFSAEACRATQIIVEEMPMVPADVARARVCLDASELVMTRKHVIEDAKAEDKPRRTMAFGTSIPLELSFLPPRNRVRENWLQCEKVPRDLETMDAVWKGITHLDSVQSFISWLRRHPEVPLPKALSGIAPKDIAAMRQSQDIEMFSHLELDLDQITSLKVQER